MWQYAQLFQNAQRGDLADLASRRADGGQAGQQQRRERVIAKADDGALLRYL
jgi:predicted chitinase